MKLLLVITGASGVNLAKKFIEYLPSDIELHLVVSDNAIRVESFENSEIKKSLKIYDNSDISASVSSGSFRVDVTAIIPCSMNTLAKIASGISDNLSSRVAAVALKEQKRLLIAPREMPFSPIALENMLKLSRLGVVISPPILGYYSNSDTILDMEKFIIGKWYDSLGIENNLYRRWEK